MARGEDKIVGTKEAAELIGVARSTFQSYLYRGYAPKPDLPPTIYKGWALPTWHRETLEEWARSRRGLGWRKGMKNDR